MPALLLWLGRVLPFLFTWILRAGKSWMGMRFGLRLTMIGVAAALIPLPTWITDLPGRLASLPDTFLYFATLAQLGFGFMVVFSAFAIRWIWQQISKSV